MRKLHYWYFIWRFFEFQRWGRGIPFSCVRRYVLDRMTSCTRYWPSQFGKSFFSWLTKILRLTKIQCLQPGWTCPGLACYDIGQLFVGRQPFSLPPILEPFPVGLGSPLATPGCYLRWNSPLGEKAQLEWDYCIDFEGEVEGSLIVGILCGSVSPKDMV